LIGVLERAGLASLVHDGLALEELQEVLGLLALGDADLTEEIGRGRRRSERESRWVEEIG
jgi:nitroreductase